MSHTQTVSGTCFRVLEPSFLFPLTQHSLKTLSFPSKETLNQATFKAQSPLTQASQPMILPLSSQPPILMILAMVLA